MRLYFVRHGESTNNVLAHQNYTREEIASKRSHDPELTENGVQQAKLVGQFLADAIDMPHPSLEPIALTKIYVSPMIRALNTAKPIAEATGLTPEVWTDIFEIGGLFTSDGKGTIRNYPGLTRQDFVERYPNYQIPEHITDEGWWDVNHGQETPDQFLGRAIKVALHLRKFAASKQRIAVVAHAAFLDSVIKALLQQLPNHPDNLFYNHYNTGITRIDFAESDYSSSPDHMRIHYMNRVDHLPVELRTW